MTLIQQVGVVLGVIGAITGLILIFLILWDRENEFIPLLLIVTTIGMLAGRLSGTIW